MAPLTTIALPEPDGAPHPPSALVLVITSTTNATANWARSSPRSDATHPLPAFYTVELFTVGIGGGPNTLKESAVVDNRTFAFTFALQTPLALNTYYYIGVTAEYGIHHSITPYSSVGGVQRPIQSVPLFSSNSGTTQQTLTWNVPLSSAGTLAWSYSTAQIWAGVPEGGGTLLNSQNTLFIPDVTPLPTTETVVFTEALSVGTTYYVRVRAYNLLGNYSTWTSSAAWSPQATVVLEMPTSLVLTIPTIQSATVTWVAAVGATGVNGDLLANGTVVPGTSFTATSTSYIWSDFVCTPGQLYTVRLRSYAGANTTSYTTSTPNVTAPTPPPTGLGFSLASATTGTVTWVAPSGGGTVAFTTYDATLFASAGGSGIVTLAGVTGTSATFTAPTALDGTPATYYATVTTRYAGPYGTTSSTASSSPTATVPVPWSPNALTNIQVWYEGSNRTTSASEVRSLLDLGPGQRHLTLLSGPPLNAGSSVWPVVSAVNGRPSVLFSANAGLRQNVDIAGSREIYWVGRQGLPTGTQQNQGFFGHNSFYYWHGVANAATFLDAQYSDVNLRSSPATLYRSGTSSTAAFGPTPVPFVGTVFLCKLLVRVDATTTFDGICYDRTGVGSGWTGDVCEILTTTSSLTGPETIELEGYLCTKWGLRGSLPTNHKYYAA